jgi:hypothetical protein
MHPLVNKRALLFVALAGLATPTGCWTPWTPPRFAQPPAQPLPDPAQAERLRAALPAAEAILREEVRKRGFPSLAVGVVHHRRLVWTLGLGPDAPDADTVFRIGSVTKLFAGLALLALRDQGKLQLDDPATTGCRASASSTMPRGTMTSPRPRSSSPSTEPSWSSCRERRPFTPTWPWAWWASSSPA